jgi:phosphotriesterase-related protein
MSPLHPLRGKIQTVEGVIDPEHLGPTLMHEHVLCDLTPPALASQGEPEVEITLENVWEIHYHWVKHLGNSRLNQEEIAVQELKRLRETGGRSLVEMTCSGMKRNPLGLRRVAQGSGVQIIMGCGTYIEEFLPSEVRKKSVEAMAQEMISDILEGAEETGIRSGIIGEIGCSYPLTDQEARGIHAAVLAQQETGASINVHPGRHPAAPFDIARMIEQAGGDLSRVIISHIDRTIFDLPTVMRLAETGCVIEFDFFGIESSHYPFQEVDLPNDGMRLRTLRSLIDEGHLSSLLISHDICTKTRLVHYGGHGYGHIRSNILPLMKQKGFTDFEIDALLIKNPRRLLTFV